jgi:uncharacterized membrane protein YdjX (TVP38/TMEM64 family)
VIAAFALVATQGDLSSERVRGWVDDAGVWAPVAFVLLSAALTVACFPGPLLAGAGGLLFGTAAGFPLCLTAAVLGACAAFLIARTAGREPVERLAGPRARALREAIARRGFLAILYARIVPGVPYNLVNYGAGLTAIRLPVFAAATALGAAPRAFAYTALGGSLDDLGSPEALAAIAVLVLMAAGGLLALRRSGSGAGWWSRASRTGAPP